MNDDDELESGTGHESVLSSPVAMMDDRRVDEEAIISTDVPEKEMPEVFACALCRKSYASKNHLNRHMKIHSDAEHNCLECGRSFTWKHSLNIHMRTHTKQRPYCCEDCGKTFSDKSWYNSHKISHTGERKYLCEICGKLFPSMGQLRKHKDTTHEFSVECEKCKATFNSKDEWEDHMKYNESHRPFPCPRCSRHFKTFHSCYSHIRYYHMNKRPSEVSKAYSCEPCGKTYRTHGRLKMHNAVHHMKPSERPRFDCSKCGKSFLSQQSIREHSCIDRFNCWVCRRKFKSKIQMELHRRSHTIEEIKKFVCKKCGRRFEKPGLLKHHKCKSEEVTIPLVMLRNGEIPKGKQKIIVQVLKPSKARHLYCRKCLLTYPNKYFAKHICVPRKNLATASEQKGRKQLLSHSTEGTTPDHALAGFKTSNISVKKESSKVDFTQLPVAEIKPERNVNQQTNQGMTFFFKFEGRGVSIIRP